MTRSKLTLAAAILAVLAGTGAAWVGTAGAVTPATPDKAIQQRQAGMKKMGDFFFPLGKKLGSVTDVTEYAAPARESAAFAKDVPSLFPPGSETGRKTRAKPEIWSDNATFRRDAEDLSVQADKLAQFAAANDKAGFVAQYKTMAQGCDTCHDRFRAPRT
jgi:cytochrome c556